MRVLVVAICEKVVCGPSYGQKLCVRKEKKLLFVSLTETNASQVGFFCFFCSSTKANILQFVCFCFCSLTKASMNPHDFAEKVLCSPVLEKYRQVFVEHGINKEIGKELDVVMLSEMGIESSLHQRLILQQLRHLTTTATNGSDVRAAPAGTPNKQSEQSARAIKNAPVGPTRVAKSGEDSPSPAMLEKSAAIVPLTQQEVYEATKNLAWFPFAVFVGMSWVLGFLTGSVLPGLLLTVAHWYFTSEANRARSEPVLLRQGICANWATQTTGVRCAIVYIIGSQLFAIAVGLFQGPVGVINALMQLGGLYFGFIVPHPWLISNQLCIFGTCAKFNCCGCGSKLVKFEKKCATASGTGGPVAAQHKMTQVLTPDTPVEQQHKQAVEPTGVSQYIVLAAVPVILLTCVWGFQVYEARQERLRNEAFYQDLADTGWAFLDAFLDA